MSCASYCRLPPGRRVLLDLFDGGSPRIWSLPIHSPIGDWRIVGVFNWDTSGSQEIELDFAQLDLNPVGAYTVFDYWGNKYYRHGARETQGERGAGQCTPSRIEAI